MTDLKNDILRFEATIREGLNHLEQHLTRRITDMEWKMKLYFAVIAALIIFTNPKVMEIAGRIFGFVK